MSDPTPASHPSLPASASEPDHHLPGRRAIVVGASSGMGAALVRLLAREGYAVHALARRQPELDELERACADAPGSVTCHAHDVTDTPAIKALFEDCVSSMGGLDLFVYAAGVMPEVGAEEYDTEKDFLQLSVNLAGCMAWCNEAALYMLTRRSGHIMGIGSIAGDRGRKGNPAYHTSKAGMSTYLESLRNRLAANDVRVTTIKPGFIATPMTDGMDGLFWLITADQAAEAMLSAVRGKATTRYVPFRWLWVALVIRHIPSFIFKKLSF